MIKLKYFGILGLTGAILVIFAVIWSYMQILEYYPAFNIFSNWMSELGVGPNIIIFNLLVIIASIFLGLFFLGLILRNIERGGNQNLSLMCLISGFSSILGLLLIGVFPMKDINEPTFLHGIAAIIYWGGSVSFWGMLTLLYRKTPDSNKREELFITLTFVAWLLFVSSFLIPLLFKQFPDTFPVIFQWTAHLFNLMTIPQIAINMVKK